MVEALPGNNKTFEPMPTLIQSLESEIKAKVSTKKQLSVESAVTGID